MFNLARYSPRALAEALAQESRSTQHAMPALLPSLAGMMLALTPMTGMAAENAATGPVDAGITIDSSMAVWSQLADVVRVRSPQQVRIEQHIIMRIAPMPGPSRESLTAIAPSAPRMIERKMGDCIPMSWIAGGQPQGGSRLLLFLRDRRLVAANLERACSARDFYRGFYVDKPNPDGRLCADRDRILARSGARCEISSFRLLVADD